MTIEIKITSDSLPTYYDNIYDALESLESVISERDKTIKELEDDNMNLTNQVEELEREKE